MVILTPVFLLLLWTGAGMESWGSGVPPHWWAWWWGEDGRDRPRPPSPCSYDKIRGTETMNAEAGARGRRPRGQTRGWTRRTTGGWSSGRAGRTGCRQRGCRTSTEMGWRLDLEVLNLVYWAVETLLESCSRTPWYWTHVCGQHIGTGSQVLIFTTLMFISEERNKNHWMFVYRRMIVVWLTQTRAGERLNNLANPSPGVRPATTPHLRPPPADQWEAALTVWGQPIRRRRLWWQAEMLRGGQGRGFWWQRYRATWLA